MRRSVGFTLVELLAVVVIIATLTAIIVPVYMRAKDSALRSDDMAGMNQIRAALQLYYTDQGGYPPALLGYATLYSSGPNMGQVFPANATQSYLYPKRVASVDTFQPALNKHGYNVRTTAVFPARDGRPIGTWIDDFNGDGAFDAADDVCGARQAYGPGSGLAAEGGGVTAGGPSDPPTAYFYNVSGYDVAEVPDTQEAANPCDASPQYMGSQGKRFELRYTLFWSDFALNQNGNSADDPRQLGYAFPPDDTIITWNSNFRNLDDNNEPERGNRDIVLFLGGSAKMFDSRALFQWSWRAPVAPVVAAPPVGSTGGGPIVGG